MLFKTHLFLISFQAVFALIVPRTLNFGTVVMDLADVDKTTTNLQAAVDGFNQSQTLLGAIPILTYRDALETAVTKSTTDATTNPTNYQFSPADAQTLGILIRGGLIPHVYSLLQSIKTKKPDFGKDVHV